METYRDPYWARDAATIALVFSFVGSLSLSWRVCSARSPSGIAFWPIAAATISLHTWLMYGIATGNRTMMYVAGWGLLLTAINATVHRWFSHTDGPGLALLTAIWILCVTLPMLSVAWLGSVASVSVFVISMAPMDRIAIAKPLPDIAVWTLVSSILWANYAALVGDVPLVMASLISSGCAVAELIAYARTLFLPDGHSTGQTA